ncbi:hypothetical protein ACFFWD_30050 [Bradyrhizobium erythrophlei]|uniref:hypothetical protein n=1 Tax=Bradyrhizobium erythrophlei TaxID=1437360 RepID=UPI0035EAA277
MKTVLLSVALLGAVTASATAATGGAMRPGAQPDALATGEGGNGAGSVKLASLVTSTFLFVPDAVQSPLVAVGEGGEGGYGRRRYRHDNYPDYYEPRYYRPYPGYPPYYAPRRYGRPYYGHRYYQRRYFEPY